MFGIEGFHYQRVKGLSTPHPFVCCMGVCRLKFAKVVSVEKHVREHFDKMDGEHWRDPLFFLKGKVRDSWYLRKKVHWEVIRGKARLLYPIPPRPASPGLEPALISLFEKASMPELGLHSWDCLLDDVQRKDVRHIIRESRNNDDVLFWVSQTKAALRDEPQHEWGSAGYIVKLMLHTTVEGFDVIFPNTANRDMPSDRRLLLAAHSDLALLWLTAKQKLLEWEHCDALKEQKVQTQTTYQEWKKENKEACLQDIRDRLYSALRQSRPGRGWGGFSHEDAIKEVLYADVFL